VLLVINAIVALVLVVLTVIKFGWRILWYRKKHIAFQRKEEDVKSEAPEPIQRPSIYIP